MKNKLKLLLLVIVVVSLGVIAGLSLIHRGLPPTHDGEYHIVRFYEFDKAIRDGDLYPRWAPDLNNGYGVPLFNYVYPLPNYVASLLHSLGISFIDSFKIEMFIATILGAVFFYLWAKEYWGYWGGMVGAIFYTYSPYHFLDIYIRGSVGEVWALAFFPAFLWSITLFIKSRKEIYFLLSPIFLSLIMFSHNILALMFFPFAVSYVLLYAMIAKTKILFNIYYLIFTIILGLGLSAIFWLPALFERQYVRGLEIFDVVGHFPDLYQLIIPSWGSGFSGKNIEGQMSFQIGVANLVVVFLSLILVGFRHSDLARISCSTKRFWSRFAPQNDDRLNVVIFFLAWFFIIVFLMLKVSLPIWKSIPFMNYFQFPWRFLSLEILIASFLAGSIVYFWRSKIVAICLVLIAFFLGIGYARPPHYLYRDDSYYLTRANFIDGTNSPGNAFNTVYFDTNLDKEKTKIKFLKGKGKIDQKVVKTTYYKIAIEALDQSEIQVNTAYFPGWSVFMDEKKTKIDITNGGLFSFDLDRGNHEIEVRLVNTTVRNLADLLFFTSIALLITLFATIRKS